MTPTDAFEQIADILVRITKRPFRLEPMTEEEWSIFVDQIMLLAEREKEHGQKQLQS